MMTNNNFLNNYIMKKTIYSLSLLVLMAGCSKDRDKNEMTDGDIRVNVSIETEKSKAVITQATGIAGVQFMKIDALSTPNDYSNLTSPTSGDIASSGAVTFATPFKYNLNNSNAYLIAYYPAKTLATGVVTWTVDGKTDIISTDAVWDAGNYAKPNNTGMILNHQLSQVEVVCKAEATSDIATVRSAWGQIKKIEFLNAPTTVIYTLNGLKVTKGTTVAAFPLLADYNGTVFVNKDVPINTNTVSDAVAMVAPIAVNTNSFQLQITTDGASAIPGDDIVKILNISLNGANEAMVKGKTHKVTLLFKANDKIIEIISSVIEPWTPGSSASSDVDKNVNN